MDVEGFFVKQAATAATAAGTDLMNVLRAFLGNVDLRSSKDLVLRANSSMRDTS